MCFSPSICSCQLHLQQQNFAASFWSRFLCLVVPPLSITPCRCPSAIDSSNQPPKYSDANARDSYNNTMVISSTNSATSAKISNCRRSTSIRTTAMSMNRCRTRRMVVGPTTASGGRINTIMATLFVLFTLSSIVMPSAQCATFFYGATDESADQDNVLNDENGQFDGARALALAESAAVQASNNKNGNTAVDSLDSDGNDDDDEEEEEEAKLSKQELHAVYNFCEILPQLQQQGFIPDNKHARDICKKLVDMLKPMFRKRAAQTDAGIASVPMPSRPRRHLATLFLPNHRIR